LTYPSNPNIAVNSKNSPDAMVEISALS